MAALCKSCYAHTEGFPCRVCGWKPGDPKGPDPFDDPKPVKRTKNDRCLRALAVQDLIAVDDDCDLDREA
jgi:hypothetical protein